MDKRIDYYFMIKNAPQISILKYMGNKKGLLNWLLPKLKKNIKPGETFLDLFAGTSSVGYALKSSNQIIANDIQQYSSTISKALLEFNQKIDKYEFINKLMPYYNKNINFLNSIFDRLIKDEEELIKNENPSEFLEFINKTPTYLKQVHSDHYKIKKYISEEYIAKKRAEPNKFPYILFSTFYINSFFGIKQCLEVDSLRYAIDHEKNNIKKSVYLSCLIYSISQSVNSTGHFAEYLKPTINHFKYIKEKRKKDIVDNFFIKLNEFNDLTIKQNWINKVYNKDAIDLIDYLSNKGILKEIKLIYIDPPYTDAQYSRYYHIPETLVKYDYPKISINIKNKQKTTGGYRNKRFQSLYSKNSFVESEFKKLFQAISSNSSATLAVSYSDNSILRPINKLVKIAENYYNVTIQNGGHHHSAQGSKFLYNKNRNNKVNEYLLICKLKRA